MSGFEACNNIIDGLYFDASFGVDAVFSNNLYTREVLSQYDVEPDKIYEPDLNKIFVDPENDDYHLRSGSPAINAGMDVGVLKDYDGITRPQEGIMVDIGPYEFVRSDPEENLPPEFDPKLGDITVFEGSLVEFIVSATDLDNDSLTYSVDNLPGWASFNESTGIFSGTPGNEDIGEHSITFIVTDDKNPPVEKIIKITVQEVPDKITITAPSSVALEQEFAVDIGFESIDEELKVLVAKLGITYNTERFDYLGYTEVEEGLAIQESTTEPVGTLQFVLANTGVENAITDNVSLLKLHFKSKDTIGSGMINVTSAEFSAVGKVDESIPYTVNPDLDNITVSVLNKILGDIDNSGTVGTSDLYYICYYYGESEESTNWNNAKKADVTGDSGIPDGKVDIADLVFVAKRILGKE